MVVAAVVVLVAVWVYVAWRIADAGRDDVGSVEHQERILRALGAAAREAGAPPDGADRPRPAGAPPAAPPIARPTGPIGARSAPPAGDGDPVGELVRSADPAPAAAARRRPSARAGLLLGAGAVTVAVGIVVAVGLATGDGGPTDDAATVVPDDDPDVDDGTGDPDAAPVPTSPPPTLPPEPEPPVAVAPEVEAVADDAVRVVVPGSTFTARVVAADGPCWIGAELDGDSVFAATLQPGEDLELSGAELTMRLGNAGVVRLEVDGEEVEFLGVSANLPADVSVVAAEA